MLTKDAQIFLSFHQEDAARIQPALAQIKAAGWGSTVHGKALIAAQELIQQCDLFMVFLSKDYILDDNLMLEEFAYTSTILRIPFLPVWLDDLDTIRQIHGDEMKGFSGAEHESKQQLISALEMLTAKHPGTTAKTLIAALEAFETDNPTYTPSVPQINEKPFEAYEGKEPYIFISYAHDDAELVYPVVKEIYEAGWDLWYDEGIKTTQRYLPVIADHVKRCSVFVLMLTNRCLERPFVMNYELEYARQCGIPVIPALLEGLHPQPWAKDIAAVLSKTAVAPEALPGCVSAGKLPNQGKRIAVPPAVRQNVIYDVIMPPVLPDFEFAVQGDTINITKYTGNAKKIVIPAEVISADSETKWSVSFSAGAFDHINWPFSVILSEGIKCIPDNAFINQDYLTKITIPKSVVAIGGSAFESCKSLRKVRIYGSPVTSSHIFDDRLKLGPIFNEDRTVLYFFSYKRWWWRSYRVPNSVNIIAPGAFYRFNRLRKG